MAVTSATSPIGLTGEQTAMLNESRTMNAQFMELQKAMDADARKAQIAFGIISAGASLTASAVQQMIKNVDTVAKIAKQGAENANRMIA